MSSVHIKINYYKYPQNNRMWKYSNTFYKNDANSPENGYCSIVNIFPPGAEHMSKILSSCCKSRAITGKTDDASIIKYPEIVG